MSSPEQPGYPMKVLRRSADRERLCLSPAHALPSPQGRVAALPGVDGRGQTVPIEDSDPLRLLRRHLPLRGRKRTASGLSAQLLRAPASVVAVLSLAGCGPPSVLPGPTFRWWLIFIIMDGFVLYAYLQSRG